MITMRMVIGQGVHQKDNNTSSYENALVGTFHEGSPRKQSKVRQGLRGLWVVNANLRCRIVVDVCSCHISWPESMELV